MNVVETLNALWPKSIPQTDYETMLRVIQIAVTSERPIVKRVSSRVAGRTAVLRTLTATKEPISRGQLAAHTRIKPARVSNILYMLKKNGKVTKHGKRSDAKWSAK